MDKEDKMDTKEEVRFCQYCGHKLPAGASFCVQCGKETVHHTEKQPRADFGNVDWKELLNRANRLAEPLVPKKLAARFPGGMPVVFVAVYVAAFIALITVFSAVLGSLDTSFEDDGYYEDYDSDYGYDYEEYDNGYDEYGEEELADTGEDMADGSEEGTGIEERAAGLIVRTTDYNRACDVTFSCIDPETGNCREISRIVADIPADGSYMGESNLGELGCRLVSDDFRKYAITKFFASNNETHAGWIDTDGAFFDVTEALGQQSKSDFDKPVRYHSLGFMKDYFVYYCDQDDVYQSVPVNDISPGSVLDGIIGINPNARSTNSCVITDWIDNKTFIANYSDNFHGVRPTSIIGKVGSDEKIFYIPGETRKNCNGFLSPDGTQIAFMSSDNTSTKLYIISINGGEPEEVMTPEDMDFGVSGHTGWDSSQSHIRTVLMDWQ